MGSMGVGLVDGSIRALTTSQRETLRPRYSPRLWGNIQTRQPGRPVWVFPQYNKLSAAWILALPSVSTYLVSPVFREVMTWHLCLPSPACQDHSGKPVGTEGARVDIWGEMVTCAKLPFDSW